MRDMLNTAWQQHRVLAGIALALAYLVLGKLGLMLAVDVGFASPVFPPAGIALAAVLLWGWGALSWIFLGSFALNVWVGYDVTQSFETLNYGIALCIAIASTLQAAFGRWLITQLLPSPFHLDNNESVIRFILSLPIICLISATLSVSALFLYGIIPSTAISENWSNWWIGDTIGMMVFSIALFCLAAYPISLWQHRSKIMLPVLITVLSVFVIAYNKTSQWEYERSLSDFEQHAQQIQSAINLKLVEQEGLLEQLGELFVFDEQSDIGRQDFRNFVAKALLRYHYVQALEWAPVIKNEERDLFEKQQRKDLPQFSIRQRDEHGQLESASERATYQPVTYVEPSKSNEAAVGFDLASNPQRREAIQKAIQLNKTIVTAPIKLVQEKQEQTGILLISAIGGKQSQSDIVLSVLRVNDFINKVTQDWQPLVMIRLTDIAEQKEIYSNFPNTDVKVFKTSKLNFGSRIYRLETAPTALYLTQHPRWQGKAVFAIGMVLIGAISMALLLGTGYTARVSTQVAIRTRELAQSREHTQAILDNLFDGIITLTPDGHITDTNHAVEQIFGYPATELIGQHICKLLTPTISKKYQNQLSEHIHNLLGANHELQGRRKNGDLFPLEICISEMIFDEKVFYNAVLRDITERKKVEKMKAEFISTVSHELRTPLTAINGSLALLSHNIAGELPQSALNMLGIAQRNGQRLIMLVNDILDMEKINAGRMEFNLQPTELRTVLEQTIENNKNYASQYQVNYKLQPFSGNLYLYVDSHRLMQILSNLLSNAAKFSPPNSQVEINVAHFNQKIRITVCDHGSGIPEEFKSRIFKQFEQADSSDTRQKGGTGLGLSITKALVEQMGGTIGFESIPNQGTEFYVEWDEYLPK